MTFVDHFWKKKDRPKRLKGNYNNSENINVVQICKQIISMTKLLRKTKNIMLASKNLNVPLVYSNTYEPVNKHAPKNVSQCVDTSKIIIENEIPPCITGVNLINRSNVENDGKVKHQC